MMSFQSIHDFLNVIAGYLWGWPMLIFLMATGIWLTLLLRGLQFWMLVPALIDAFKGGSRHGAGTISNRSALMTALAATVGTGNIAGVATAIAIGGPGAMFWMWMSGLLGMALKFSEVLLGVHYRVRTADGQYRGGPMYYLSRGVKSKFLAGAFALFLAFATLSIGGMVQSNSIADAMASGFGLSPTLVGIAIVAVSALIMFGGLKNIARTADLLVPFMIILYAGAGTLVILANVDYLPTLLKAIFTDAFSGTAATGGFAGASVMIAMRYGLARGVFANESGLGSAPIVAAAAKTRHPTEQALISMTQTFIDTFFVCTFTGMVILISGAWQSAEMVSAGASLTNMAFDAGLGGATVLGYPLGSSIVAISLLLFAFTTILGWGYYGQQGAVYLWGRKAETPYLVVFLAATLFGAVVLDLAGSIKDGVHFVWVIADIAVGLMMIPNLYALWVLSPKIRALTVDYLRSTKTGRAFSHTPFYEAVEAVEAAAAAPVKTVRKAVKAKAKPAKQMVRKKARRKR